LVAGRYPLSGHPNIRGAGGSEAELEVLVVDPDQEDDKEQYQKDTTQYTTAFPAIVRLIGHSSVFLDDSLRAKKS
jgi:hypothetical protein